jgi:hypothetical protein
MAVKELSDPVTSTSDLPSLLRSPQTTELNATPGRGTLVSVSSAATAGEKTCITRAMANATAPTPLPLVSHRRAIAKGVELWGMSGVIVMVLETC